MNGPIAPAPEANRAVVIGGLAIYLLAGIATAVVETLLVPLRHGTVMIPLAVPLAIGTNIALPLLSRRLTDTMSGGLPPVIGWIGAVLVLGGGRPEGDVLLPGGPGDKWVSYGFLLGGAIAGLITVSLGSVRRSRLDADTQTASGARR
jgi:hypothetical protein